MGNWKLEIWIWKIGIAPLFFFFFPPPEKSGDIPRGFGGRGGGGA